MAYENVFLAARLRGPMSEALAQELFEALMVRHESLRTTLHERGGRVVQAVDERAAANLLVCDVRHARKPSRELTRCMLEALAEPFYLSRAPMVRPLMIRAGERDTVLVLVLPHSISDGVCRAIFHEEIAGCYESISRAGRGPAQLPLQLRDVARWERRDHSAACRHWSAELSDLQLPELYPLTGGCVRPSEFVEVSARAPLAGPALIGAIRRLAVRLGVPSAAVVLAVVAVVLSARSGCERILLGVYHHNRHRRGTKLVLGSLFDVLPLLIRVEPSATFSELAISVAAQLADADRHPLPWALARAAFGGRFDVAVNFYRDNRQPTLYPSCKGGVARVDEYRPAHTRRASFPIAGPWWGSHVTIDVRAYSEGPLEVATSYNPYALTAKGAARLASQVRDLLARASLSPSEQVRRLAAGCRDGAIRVPRGGRRRSPPAETDGGNQCALM